MMEGRWLESGKTHGIVVSFKFLEQEPSFHLGGQISFQFAGVRQEFEIVGIIYEIGDSNIYMSKNCYEQFVPEQAKRSSINIVTQKTGGRRSEKYEQIYNHASESGISILHAATKADKQEMLSSHFSTTLTSYMVVAVLAVVVAGFGLSTTMKIQVQESTREIGILKSIGANRKQVFSIITTESVYTYLFSFCNLFAAWDSICGTSHSDNWRNYFGNSPYHIPSYYSVSTCYLAGCHLDRRTKRK